MMESTVTLNLRFVKRCHERPRSNSGSLSCLGYQRPRSCLQHSRLPEPRSDHRVTPTRLLPLNIRTQCTPSPTFFFFFLACVSHFLPVVLKAGIRELLVSLVPGSWAVAKGRLQAPLLGPSWSSSLCVPVSGPRSPSSYEDGCHTELGPTLAASA